MKIYRAQSPRNQPSDCFGHYLWTLLTSDLKSYFSAYPSLSAVPKLLYFMLQSYLVLNSHCYFQDERVNEDDCNILNENEVYLANQQYGEDMREGDDWEEEANKLYEWTQELSFDEIAATPRLATAATVNY